MNVRVALASLAAWGASLGGSSPAFAQNQPPEPINVSPQVFFNQSCPSSHAIYQVPTDKLLVIEDASARAVDAATASDPANPGILNNVPLHLSLRTNPTGESFGSADHIIVSATGLPLAGGRTMRGYAAPDTNVLFLIGGCPTGVTLNITVSFAGQLLDFP